MDNVYFIAPSESNNIILKQIINKIQLEGDSIRKLI